MSENWNSEPSGVSTFLSLADTPSSYSGQAGKGVQVNPGETALQFYTLVDTDEKVKISANDTTAGYLNGKLVQGAGITLTENNDGGNETFTIALNATGDWTGTFDGQEGNFYLARANHTGTQLAATISNFDEAAQDAIGAMVDTTLVYVDGTPLLTRAALTGDIAVPQASNVTTLATVNLNVGAFGSATQVATFTVNAKGLTTAAANVSIQITESQVTNLTTDLAAKQPLDATLTALAAHNTNGLLTQTSADTFTGRTITGTASRLSVSNGNGVSGNPTLDIDAAYVGQSSITTVGTLTGGATGVGFTVALGTSTLTGDLPFANLTQIAGFSILAKVTTGIGDVAALTAGTDSVLMRSGSGDLVFSTIVTNQISADAVTYAKFQNMTTARLLGRTTASSGDIEELTAGTSLSLTGGSLNAIQDIRTTATPTFAGGTFNGQININSLVGIQFASAGGANHDFNLASNADYFRLFACPTLTATPDGAAWQCFGNTSALPGQMYFDSGAINGAGIYLRTCGTSGTITQRLYLDYLGNQVLGALAALATNATDGFTYIPTCAGTPTGVPTGFTGKVPLVMDTTNSKLYARIGGAWKSTTFA